jgi:uncharacterized protein
VSPTENARHVLLRLILLVLLGFVIFALYKGFKRSIKGDGQRPPGDKAVERMVTCAQCGVHLPESDCVTSGGKHYCCEEHRRLAG